MAKEGSAVGQGDGTDVASAEKNRSISKNHLAAGLTVGMRFPRRTSVKQTPVPWHLQELLKSHGRWRIVVFPGDLQNRNNFDRMVQQELLY